LIGQENIVTDINIQVEASKGKLFPHTAIFGESGYGKTRLANILAGKLEAKEKGRPRFIVTTGTKLKSAIDLEEIGMLVGNGDVLFIDEIHGIVNRSGVAEILYEMMDRFSMNGSRIGRFTCIGATNHFSSLPPEFRNRFILQYRLNPYTDGQIALMLEEIGCPNDMSLLIAQRSRGNPRLAKSVIFFKTQNEANVVNNGTVTINILDNVLGRIVIDEKGMDPVDRSILHLLYKKNAFMRRNAMGAGTICDQIGIKEEDLKGIYEPYLFRLGLIEKTARGRILTPDGRDYIEERMANG
jgi:Holliday junction DNA helicase RuvB